MFTNLRLKNFKAWGDQLWNPGLELAPLTLLLGANSAGKTSILQAPLLLQQTFGSPDRTLDLNLGGQADERLTLGSFSDVVCGHDPSRTMGIGLRFVHNGAPAIDYEAEWVNRDHAVLQRLAYHSGDDEFAAERTSRGGYKLTAPGYTTPAVGTLDFRPERSVVFSPEAVDALRRAERVPASQQPKRGTGRPVSRPQRVAKPVPQSQRIQDIAANFHRAISQVAYLGPLREPPRRTYLWADQNPGNLGDTGKNAVMALLASKHSRRRGGASEEAQPEWLVERTSHWLERLGLAARLELQQQGRSRHYEVSVHRGGDERANLVDVGFGVSQVLPMIVLAHFVPHGTTIIAEQPEIHLHPRAQAGLAELLVEVAKTRSVQFIVETHSEHMFRHLQYMVADQQLAPELCRLYFVDRHDSGVAKLDQLKMDTYGRVSNWPKQFFGDALGDSERQMDRMFDRMAAEKRDAK